MSTKIMLNLSTISIKQVQTCFFQIMHCAGSVTNAAAAPEIGANQAEHGRPARKLPASPSQMFNYNFGKKYIKIKPKNMVKSMLTW